MLGHAEEWFYRGLGGIDIDFSRPKDRRLLLRPYAPAKIGSVHTRYDSAFGSIASGWMHNGGNTIYFFDIPANTTATVELRTASPGSVTVNKASAAKAAGVLSSREENGKIEMVLGSGQYRIQAANAEQNP